MGPGLSRGSSFTSLTSSGVLQSQNSVSRNSGVCFTPTYPPPWAAQFPFGPEGKRKEYTHNLINKQANEEGAAHHLFALPCIGVGILANQGFQTPKAGSESGNMWQLLTVTPPSESHLECKLCVAFIFYCSARLFTGATLLPIS